MANPFSDLMPSGAADNPSTPSSTDANPFADLMTAKRATQQGATPLPSAKTDPYAGLDTEHREARQYLDQHPEAKHGFANSMAGKIVQGSTMGWSDEALAGFGALRDWVKHPGQHSLTHYYSREKAMQDEQLKDATETTGVWGTLAELAGGLGTGVGAAKAGLTLMRPGQSLGARALSGALEGAGYGGVSGAGNSDGNRIGGGISGAAVGGALGGALPVVVEVAKNWTPVSSIVSSVKSNVNPRGFAEEKVGEALRDSGKTADEINATMARARSLGQEDFTLADAMGKEGQRLLTATAKQSGPARPAVNDFLNNRQMGASDRIGSYVDEAFGADATGKQTAARLTQEARDASRPLYKQAENYPIQGSQVTAAFLNDPIAKRALEKGIAAQRLEDLARNPGTHNPADFTISGYNAAASEPGVISATPNMRTLDAVKRGLDDILNEYRDKTTGRLMLDGEGDAIDGFRRAYLQHLDELNPMYKSARQAYAGPAAERGAIDLGRRAAGRAGSAADNIDAFNKLTQPEQSGWRVGYADKLNRTLEGARDGVDHAANFARPKTRAEIDAFAVNPEAAQRVQQRLQNERMMHSTRNQALGGPATAENLSDMQGLGQHVMKTAGNLVSGNFASAALDTVKFIFGHGGNNKNVRAHIADILLSGRANLNDLPTGLRGPLQRMNVLGPSADPNNVEALLRVLEDKNIWADNVGAGIRRGISSAAVPVGISRAEDARKKRAANHGPVTVQVTPENIDAFLSRNPARLLDQPGVARAGDGYVQNRKPAKPPVVEYRTIPQKR